MPQRKLRLTREEENDDRRSLDVLKSLGIRVRGVGIRPQPETLGISVSSCADAFLCELTPGEVGIIVPIEIVPLRPHALISDCQITLPWESTGFAIRDADASPWYDYLFGYLGWQPRTVLNHWVTGDAPLPHKLAGVIIGFSSVEIPLQFPENMPVVLETTFTDDRGLEYGLSANAKLDRRLREQAQQRMLARKLSFVSQRGGFDHSDIARMRVNAGVEGSVKADNPEKSNGNPKGQQPSGADNRRSQH